MSSLPPWYMRTKQLNNTSLCSLMGSASDTPHFQHSSCWKKVSLLCPQEALPPGPVNSFAPLTGVPEVSSYWDKTQKPDSGWRRERCLCSWTVWKRISRLQGSAQAHQFGAITSRLKSQNLAPGDQFKPTLLGWLSPPTQTCGVKRAEREGQTVSGRKWWMTNHNRTRTSPIER